MEPYDAYQPPFTRKILVAPLDWGMGHAARTIPLIHALRSYGNCQVLLGVSGHSGELLKAEFPSLEAVDLPALSMKYSAGRSQVLRIFFQIPRMILSVIREHYRLKKLVRVRQISAVISDNRYGLYCRKVPSILILHQLQFRFPPGVNFLSGIFSTIQAIWIKRFNQVWIPDLPGANSAAGVLSDPPAGLHHTYHIGLLSRFFYGKTGGHPVDDPYPLVALLSGPEPQRTQLEQLVEGELKQTGQRALLIRGVIGDGVMRSRGGVTRVSHMLSGELHRHLQSAGVVVCRSGYSSVMDLIALGKRAVLIPTPGQPEQEYLAAYLGQKGWFYSQHQHMFNLHEALQKVRDYFPPRVSVSGQLFRQINRLFEDLDLKKGEGQDQNRQAQTKT